MKKILNNFSKVMVAVCILAVAPLMLASCDKDKTPAHVHELTHVEAVTPTCTTDGNKEYWHCAGCDKNFDAETNGNEIDNVVVSATGHNYEYKYNAEEYKYTQICKNNATHTGDTKNAGETAEFPYLVGSEAELNTVLSRAGENVYIALTGDVTTSSVLVIRTSPVKDDKTTYNRNIVLDLQNHTLTTNAVTGVIGSGTFTAINGNIKNTSATGANPAIQLGSDNEDRVKFVLDNIKFTSVGYGISVLSNTTLVVQNKSNLEAVGLTLSTNNGDGGSIGQNIVVKDSIVTSTEETAIFMSSYVTLTVSDNSVVTGKFNAIHVRMGVLNLENCTIKQTATEVNQLTQKSQLGKQGTEEEGVGIVFRANVYYDSNAKTNGLTVNIADSVKFECASNVNFLVYNCADCNGSITGKENAVDQMDAIREALKNKTVSYYVISGENVVPETVKP